MRFNISIESIESNQRNMQKRFMAHEQNQDHAFKIVYQIIKKGIVLLQLLPALMKRFQAKRFNILEKHFGFEWNDIPFVDFHASGKNIYFHTTNLFGWKII